MRIKSYPEPIIQEKEARKKAAELLYGLRKNNKQHHKISREIVNKHGSRKSGLRNRTVNKMKNHHSMKPTQLTFPV